MIGIIETNDNYTLTKDVNNELCFSLKNFDLNLIDKINGLEISRLIVRQVDFNHELLSNITNINKIKGFTNDYGGTGIKFIEELTGLESLTLSVNTKEKLSFSNFSNLKNVNIKWQINFDTDFFILDSLTTLILSNYSNNNLDDLVNLKNIEFLQLEKCKTSSLDGINTFQHLKTLYLTNLPNLNVLTDLEGNEFIEKIVNKKM